MNQQEIIEKTELQIGSHESFEKGSCIMELVSYLANEPWSDNPKCACPVLTKFAIKCNDRWPYEKRQELKKLIPKLLNSRDSEKIKPRYELLVIRNTTVILPIFLDALGLVEEANHLRKFKVGEWIAIRDYINLIEQKVRAAAAYAAAAVTYAYAYADAAAAAYAAAAVTYAYAYADATAYAAAADAADAADAVTYAYAYAADAAADADADAAAAAAAAAAAYAAAAAAAAYAKKEKCLMIRDQIHDEAYKSLEMACDL